MFWNWKQRTFALFLWHCSPSTGWVVQHLSLGTLDLILKILKVSPVFGWNKRNAAINMISAATLWSACNNRNDTTIFFGRRIWSLACGSCVGRRPCRLLKRWRPLLSYKQAELPGPASQRSPAAEEKEDYQRSGTCWRSNCCDPATAQDCLLNFSHAWWSFSVKLRAPMLLLCWDYTFCCSSSVAVMRNLITVVLCFIFNENGTGPGTGSLLIEFFYWVL